MFATVATETANPYELLETLEPGPELAAALDAIDRHALTGNELVSVMIAHRRLASHYSGEMYRDIAAVEAAGRSPGGMYHQSVENTAAEVGAALVLTRRSAETETHLALELVWRLPQVLQALVRGDLDVARARVLAQGTEHLPDAVARRVVDSLIDDTASLTTGQLGAKLRRRCIAFDPDAAVKRYRRSVQDRRVYMVPSAEGTAHLFGLDLPPERVAAFTRYLDKAARELRRCGDGRTMDQLRADIYLDILTGTRHPAANGPATGGVHISVDLATLAGLDENPAELAGYGPVAADVARQVADHQARTQWDFIVTDPATGDIIHTGTTRRRPTVSQRRRITARYPSCVWLGCRMPSVDCDLDHRIPHSHGGCSHDHNLAPLCRFHHRIRHQAGWSYRRLANGDHTWTSPLTRTYTTSGRSP